MGMRKATIWCVWLTGNSKTFLEVLAFNPVNIQTPNWLSFRYFLVGDVYFNLQQGLAFIDGEWVKLRRWAFLPLSRSWGQNWGRWYFLAENHWRYNLRRSPPLPFSSHLACKGVSDRLWVYSPWDSGFFGEHLAFEVQDIWVQLLKWWYDPRLMWPWENYLISLSLALFSFVKQTYYPYKVVDISMR